MAVMIVLKSGQTQNISAGAKVGSGTFPTTESRPGAGWGDALVVKDKDDQVVAMFRAADVTGYAVS